MWGNRDICSLLKKYDKSYFNDGTDQAVFSEWERNNSVAIPEELKDLLSVSNGLQVLGRTATVFSVDDIGFRYKGIPEEYIVFGEITGDDEKLCFHEKTGELVTIKDGVVYKYSAEAFLEYCIDQGLDGMFMSDTDSSAENRVLEYIENRSGRRKMIEKKMEIKFIDSGMNRVGDKNNIRMRG